MIHRERRTIVVTRECRETRLRTEDDVLDFVGTGEERLQVVRLWDEISRDKSRASEARTTLDVKDREALSVIGRGDKLPGKQGPRIGRLKRLGYVTESGKLTAKGRRETAPTLDTIETQHEALSSDWWQR